MKAHKQTSSRVSTLAAKWLRECELLRPHYWTGITARELKTLCASLISQDETAGQGKPLRIRSERFHSSGQAKKKRRGRK